MTFTWTEHRFAGGLLALDLANTIVFAGDPARRIDRLGTAGELAAFVEAAARLTAVERPAAGFVFAGPEQALVDARALRDSLDRLVRPLAGSGAPPASALADLLGACRRALGEAECVVGPHGLAPQAGRVSDDFLASAAFSALRLVFSPELARVKICPNCHWLFLDRSRNASRVWCDMAVCGNRAKVRRHYRRVREEAADAEAERKGRRA